MDEERTHKVSVDLEDNVGVIDLFVTITGIVPVQESINDAETSSNSSLDIVPSKITDGDIEYYVCIKELCLFYNKNNSN